MAYLRVAQQEKQPKSAYPDIALSGGGQKAIRHRPLHAGNGTGQLFIDHMEMLGPIAHMLQLACAIRDSTQAKKRNPDSLAGPQAGICLHIHHIGFDPLVSLTGNDVPARRKGRRVDPRHTKRQFNGFRQIEKGVTPFSKPMGEASMSR